MLSMFYHFWAVQQNNYKKTRQKAPCKVKAADRVCLCSQVIFWVYIRKTQTQKPWSSCSCFLHEDRTRNVFSFWLLAGAQGHGQSALQGCNHTLITSNNLHQDRTRKVHVCLGCFTQVGVWNSDINPSDFTGSNVKFWHRTGTGHELIPSTSLNLQFCKHKCRELQMSEFHADFLVWV